MISEQSVLDMEDVTDSDGRDRNGSRHKPSNVPLPETSFYTKLLGDPNLGSFLQRTYGTKFDLARIVDNVPRLHVYGGMEEKGRHYRVGLLEHGGVPSPVEVFLKIVRKDDNKDVSSGLGMDFNERMQYQADQLRYWNHLRINAPMYFGIEHHIFDSSEVFWYAVELWNGTLHDANILALQEAERSVDDRIKNGGNGNLKSAKTQIQSEREKIMSSVLDTIVQVHLKGTEGLRDYQKDNSDFFVHTPKDVESFYVEERAARYFNFLLRYNLVQLRAKNKFLPYDERDMDALTTKFKDLVRPFIAPFYNSGRYVYAQGDEYLHNFLFRGKKNGDNDERVSGIFDTEHVLMTLPAYSFAKTLTSFIARRSIAAEEAEVRRIFSNADGRYLGYDDSREFMRDYWLVSFVTRFFDMGKRAFNGLMGVERNFNFSRGREYTMQESGIEFPVVSPPPSSVVYPGVDESLRLQKMGLLNRFARVTEGKEPFAQVLTIHDIKSIDEIGKFLIQNFKE